MGDELPQPLLKSHPRSLLRQSVRSERRLELSDFHSLRIDARETPREIARDGEIARDRVLTAALGGAGLMAEPSHQLHSVAR